MAKGISLRSQKHMTMFMDYGVDKNNWTANNVEREFNSDGIQVHGNIFHWKTFLELIF